MKLDKANLSAKLDEHNKKNAIKTYKSVYDNLFNCAMLMQELDASYKDEDFLKIFESVYVKSKEIIDMLVEQSMPKEAVEDENLDLSFSRNEENQDEDEEIILPSEKDKMEGVENE